MDNPGRLSGMERRSVMILSASRHTDIPRYYSDWLLHRLKAGTVLLQNPMNKAQISRLTFSPETMDCNTHRPLA